MKKILELTRQGKYLEAGEELKSFISKSFNELSVKQVVIQRDSISLNSVNGTILLSNPFKNENKLFFKFHKEEEEEGIIKEYYNAEILKQAGFPVEMPILMSKEVGKQILIYTFNKNKRFFDVCKINDKITNKKDKSLKNIFELQKKLDEKTCKIYLSSLHRCDKKDALEESILKLFYWRLVEGIGKEEELGGRVKKFYINKTFEFPNNTKISWNKLSKLKWKINGVTYKETLLDAFLKAKKLLSIESHKNCQAVVAHGDAHNGNIWYNEKKGLTLFDPAFAGKNIPALLAEIKPTFHNIFAHPLWLYDSKSSKFKVEVKINDDTIIVQHNWKLTPIREGLFDIKLKYLWIPLISKLKKEGVLIKAWQNYIRSALFCCPTLVMNLRANAGTPANIHTPDTSLLGLSIAIMLSSEPVKGEDYLTYFFSKIEEKLK
ncbi:hypothetical protein ACFL0U_02350 [Pseudomonadota bacterium]